MSPNERAEGGVEVFLDWRRGQLRGKSFGVGTMIQHKAAPDHGRPHAVAGGIGRRAGGAGTELMRGFRRNTGCAAHF